MAEKRKAGSLIFVAAGFVLSVAVSGCVVAKDTYQAEVVRANDLEAKAEDLEFRLRERSDNERKLEKRAGEAESRAAEADRKVRIAQSATEEVKASLAVCGREKEALAAEVEAGKKSSRALEEQLTQQKGRVREAEERAREAKAASEAQLSRQSANIEQMRSRIADLTAERDVLTEKMVRTAGDRKERVEESLAAFDALSLAFQAEIGQGLVWVLKEGGQVLVSFRDDLFFQPGGAELRPDGARLLSVLAGAVAFETGKVFLVEGHTDNVRFTGAAAEKYPTGWELSSARAVAVVRFLAEKGGLDGARLGAVAYGEFRPVADNSTSEGRQRNRRVDIRLAPSAAQQQASPSEATPAAQASDADSRQSPLPGGKPSGEGAAQPATPSGEPPAQQKPAEPKP